MKISKWISLIIGLGILVGGTIIINKLRYPVANSIYKHLQEKKIEGDTVISLFGPKKPEEHSAKEETITIERNGLPPIKMTRPKVETLDCGLISRTYKIFTPEFLEFPKTDNPDYKRDETSLVMAYKLAIDAIAVNKNTIPFIGDWRWNDDVTRGIWFLYLDEDIYFIGRKLDKKSE